MPEPRKMLTIPLQRVFVGVDPGKKGGIALLYQVGLVEHYPIPEEERDKLDMFETLATRLADYNYFVMLEKVSGFIGRAQPGSAMFNFGMGYGGLRMAMLANDIAFEEVTPQAWQKGLGVATRPKGEKHRFHKMRLKALAQEMFPEQKVTMKTGDALLIAEYARRYCNGSV